MNDRRGSQLHLGRGKYELDTPTIALVVPMNFERWDSFSVANASRIEAKLTYVRLNTQTPCPPRGAVPVNQGRSRRLFHSLRPDRLRSWMRLAPLCRWTDIPMRRWRQFIVNVGIELWGLIVFSDGIARLQKLVCFRLRLAPAAGELFCGF